VVPADHRLSNRDWIDPEELALETIPTLPDNHHLGAWAAIHFPDHTPSGRPIARGPVVTTIRESLAAVESGEAVVIVERERSSIIPTPASDLSRSALLRRYRSREAPSRSSACDTGPRGMRARCAAGLVDAVEH